MWFKKEDDENLLLFCIDFYIITKIILGDNMKISFIKYENEPGYNLPQILGMNVEKIKEPEDIDKKIEELKQQEYTTIVISNELASFSEDIISKYKYDSALNIVIMP